MLTMIPKIISINESISKSLICIPSFIHIFPFRDFYVIRGFSPSVWGLTACHLSAALPKAYSFRLFRFYFTLPCVPFLGLFFFISFCNANYCHSISWICIYFHKKLRTDRLHTLRKCSRIPGKQDLAHICHTLPLVFLYGYFRYVICLSPVSVHSQVAFLYQTS